MFSKASRILVALGLNMDRSEEHSSADEFCYIDAKHGRCKGLKAILLWVFDPVLHKVVKLATVEVESETTNSFILF